MSIFLNLRDGQTVQNYKRGSLLVNHANMKIKKKYISLDLNLKIQIFYFNKNTKYALKRRLPVFIFFK